MLYRTAGLGEIVPAQISQVKRKYKIGMPDVHLVLARDVTRTFPEVEDPDAIRSARIWFCKYNSLEQLANLRNLEELVIAGFPDDSLDFIGRMEKLYLLSILHMPKVSNIAPLAGLKRLTTLSLSTLPSWDSSRKTSTILSLEPLASIPKLAHLELFGICPPNKSLLPLESCKCLETVRVSQYPRAEVARFYAKTGLANQFNPEPSYE